MSVSDLATGQDVSVEEKPIHAGMLELLQNAAQSVAEARALSHKLALHPNPGQVMGAMLAANVSAIESLTQAFACAYNAFSIGMNTPMKMHKVGKRQRVD